MEGEIHAGYLYINEDENDVSSNVKEILTIQIGLLIT